MEANYVDLAEALRGRGLRVFGCDGGYFLVADASPLHMTAMQYLNQMVNECGVACAPMSVFYASADGGGQEAEGLLRFALCKSRAFIADACGRLRRNSW